MKYPRWILLVALPTIGMLASGCSKKKGADGPEDARVSRDTKIVLEKCAIESQDAKKVDSDGDGRPEIVQVNVSGKEVCRTADLNFDGRIDRTTFFDNAGKIRRVESDFDRDGRIDELSLFENGAIKEKHRATAMAGKLDTWEFYAKGEISRTERDENGDGYIDQWWEYPSRGCPLIHMDTNGDGRPDPGSSIDYCKETGYTPPPLPNADRPPEKPADFGSDSERVEETENSATDSAPAPTGGEGAAEP